ncbi:MAG: cupredoxin domain-containing protein [Alphaproteobacteria bacterium]|nr:cupredoxin domain-containing protein [Alphaproteobacteria bacterium]
MVFGIVLAGRAFAVEAPKAEETKPVHNINLTIKNHLFDQNNIEAPANEKFTITVMNKDETPEEFESKDMRREKIVPANGTVVVNVGPLKPGVYKFFGEYHEDTAKGIITVK